MWELHSKNEYELAVDCKKMAGFKLTKGLVHHSSPERSLSFLPDQVMKF